MSYPPPHNARMNLQIRTSENVDSRAANCLFDTLRTRFDTLRHDKKNFPGVQAPRKCRLSTPAPESPSTFCPRYPRLSTIKNFPGAHTFLFSLSRFAPCFAAYRAAEHAARFDYLWNLNCTELK